MLQVVLVVKSSPAKAGDIRDSVESLRWEDPLEKEMATHSCLESPMDRGAWRATVHKVAERWILNWAGLKRFSTHMHTQSEKAMAPHSSTLAWKNPMDRRAWRAAVHGVAKSRTRLSDFTFTFHFHALEKAMATHSSVLAWRIPGTGEPGGLPSMGSHRVGHDWSDLAAVAAAAWVYLMHQYL